MPTLAQYLVHTPLGWMLLQGNENYITHASWPEEENIRIGGENASTATWKEEAARQIEEYFAGTRLSFSLPLQPEGTDFQQTVWKALREIPFGTTTTYAKLGDDFRLANHARPVGTAIGANPLLLLIPCHRVKGSDGSLTGYAGGLNRKEWLLRHEGALDTQQLRLF